MKKFIVFMLMVIFVVAINSSCTTQRSSHGCSATKGKVGY